MYKLLTTNNFLKTNQIESVFLCFISDIEISGYKIPTVFSLNRWDGKIGFPGGEIDSGETKIEALKRELKEEINFEVEEKELFYFSSFFNEKRINHLYISYIENYKLKELIKNITESKDYFNEIFGFVNVSIIDKTYNNFLQNNFAGSCKEELILIKEMLKDKE